EVQLFHLARNLVKENDVTLQVVLLNHGQLEQKLRASDVNVCVIDESALSGLTIMKKFNQIVKIFKPDVVHTHRIKENVIGGLIARLRGCKSIRTVHGASEFSQAPFSLKRFIFDSLDRVSAIFFQQKIIAVSFDLGQMLSNHLPKSKIETIANSVDQKFIYDQARQSIDYSYPDARLNVAFVGRFVPVKRPDYFVEIARLVADSQSSVKNSIHFFMIGDGPLKSEIETKVKTHHLGDHVHFTGFVENTAPYLQHMDLLLFTSDHEGLPMTLLESMSLGVAVGSRPIDSIASVLCNKACGFFPNVDSPAEFAQLVLELAENRQALLQITTQAREQLDANYSINQNVKRYKQIYIQLVA
ncbi:MAG: glycosyltransferase, partial [Gammaproteobacteria bacterium]|nr:glycosyltransferase [Gammaproteobacteria bacterium]